MQIGECAGQTKIAPEGAIFLIPKEDFGGAIQSRTGLDEFANHCIGILPLRQLKPAAVAQLRVPATPRTTLELASDLPFDRNTQLLGRSSETQKKCT